MICKSSSALMPARALEAIPSRRTAHFDICFALIRMRAACHVAHEFQSAHGPACGNRKPARLPGAATLHPNPHAAP